LSFVLFLLAALPARAGVESPPGLVDVRAVNSRIQVEMRYAGADNFTGEVLYPFDGCYLQPEVAGRLSRVQRDLERRGWGLKVWDCYRPFSVQKRLWSRRPDSRFIADPGKGGSKHNRGAAVDVTLVDARGREAAMPTGFDDFSPRAGRTYRRLPREVARRRDLLRRTMEARGFLGVRSEWWHFNAVGWGRYPVRDDLPSGDPSTSARSPSKVMETSSPAQEIHHE
jgi:D-alanyl-D-alanine dipeptidase